MSAANRNKLEHNCNRNQPESISDFDKIYTIYPQISLSGPT